MLCLHNKVNQTLVTAAKGDEVGGLFTDICLNPLMIYYMPYSQDFSGFNRVFCLCSIKAPTHHDAATTSKRVETGCSVYQRVLVSSDQCSNFFTFFMVPPTSLVANATWNLSINARFLKSTVLHNTHSSGNCLITSLSLYVDRHGLPSICDGFKEALWDVQSWIYSFSPVLSLWPVWCVPRSSWCCFFIRVL